MSETPFRSWIATPVLQTLDTRFRLSRRILKSSVSKLTSECSLCNLETGQTFEKYIYRYDGTYFFAEDGLYTFHDTPECQRKIRNPQFFDSCNRCISVRRDPVDLRLRIYADDLRYEENYVFVLKSQTDTLPSLLEIGTSDIDPIEVNWETLEALWKKFSPLVIAFGDSFLTSFIHVETLRTFKQFERAIQYAQQTHLAIFWFPAINGNFCSSSEVVMKPSFHCKPPQMFFDIDEKLSIENCQKILDRFNERSPTIFQSSSGNLHLLLEWPAGRNYNSTRSYLQQSLQDICELAKIGVWNVDQISLSQKSAIFLPGLQIHRKGRRASQIVHLK
jgi:hypothetical protein